MPHHNKTKRAKKEGVKAFGFLKHVIPALGLLTGSGDHPGAAISRTHKASGDRQLKQYLSACGKLCASGAYACDRALKSDSPKPQLQAFGFLKGVMGGIKNLAKAAAPIIAGVAVPALAGMAQQALTGGDGGMQSSGKYYDDDARGEDLVKYLTEGLDASGGYDETDSEEEEEEYDTDVDGSAYYVKLESESRSGSPAFKKVDPANVIFDGTQYWLRGVDGCKTNVPVYYH